MARLARWVAAWARMAWGRNMEIRVRATWAVVLFIAAALGALLPATPSWSQDWVPVFRSDEATPPSVLGEDNGPKTAKRATVHKPRRKPRQYASTSKSMSQEPARRVQKLAIQVAENNPQLMNLALNNARNVVEYYKSKGEEVAIEVVTFGPGLHMLRDDTSPVKQRISAMALETPDVTFIACANTQANMSKQESKPITLISEAKVMPSGVVRLMELKGRGYAYLRP
jgi:intracellular sulfur oxidation DsrE/DsrF family protein